MSKLSLSVEKAKDRPILPELPGATATGLTLPPGLSYETWENIGRTLGDIASAHQWWMGDWWRYGEQAYGERASQALDSRWSFQTWMDAGWVAGKIETSRRREVLSWSHHREVAALEPDVQDEWLDRAEAEDWSRNELRQRLVRAPKAGADTPALPVGVFSTIVADPPWDILTGPDWGSGGPARPLLYPTMSVEAIAALPIKELAADDAHLYLWTINAYLTEAYEIAESWGFTPSTLLTWCKRPHGIGLGGTYILTTEHVLFARRGSLAAQERIDTTWFDWPRRDHSVKPDEFFTMVEEVSPGPHLELFARQPRPGWTVWGDEVPDEAVG